MTTGIELQSATIYQFPVGGRAGVRKRGHGWSDESTARALESANHFDWRAAYHDAAISEDTGCN
ncbi:DUF2735 domain-containing protein [Fulvimarina sp. MAC3]|uniref:DUF2735 domain-containing protein n=1 Tax=Fulvimarina sp. MAC3 TaxID=3148887 RepID=UPI0031FD60B4